MQNGRIDACLEKLGLVLPPAVAPVANYVPWVVLGTQVVISGQLPMRDGSLMTTGLLGREVSVDDGAAAARQCALNLLTQLKAACGGNLDRVQRVVRLGGFVACTPDFTDHPKVINGASDLMVQVFGDAGRHARAAVGCPSLPLGAAVEVDGVFEIAP
ncbi:MULTISPECIES: RidA family protein [unclassified Haematospirillum]|uniref:RidA family protein n=1 Tax=unclassified Haematospirillum TaxID=2622088 RepID=UPI00143B0173|nr:MULTISPECIES: RidA family protein [unclassified Haematospirillum]NKD54124.1 RidA family protein [Haematospirillum sp. H4890]NKD74169.1 RidA family protein [Haematospirillum sp. H4485]NKD87162.1 RidA family protein [Haematospirillum sp. 15-248]